MAGGLNLYGYADGDPINKADPFGLRACDPPGTCRGTLVAAGAAVGAAAGITIAGGCTVGTGGICAAGAPAIVAATTGLGTAVGGLAGEIAENFGTVVESINWGRIARTIGLLGGLAGGDAGTDLAKRLLEIERARAAAAKTASEAEKERRQRAEEKKQGGEGGGSPNPETDDGVVDAESSSSSRISDRSDLESTRECEL